MKLADVLRSLDPNEDGNWTSNGSPLMSVIHDATGDKTIKRSDVTAAAPTLTREAVLAAAAADAAALPDEPEDGAGVEPEAPKLPPSTTIAASSMNLEPAVEEMPTLPGLLPGQSVLELTQAQICASPELTTAALGEITERINEGNQRRTAIDDELHKLNAGNEILKRAHQAQQGRLPKGERMSAVLMYQRSQQAERQRRSDRAQEFIKHGTTAKDVAAALNGKSPLDRAMNVRKAGRGRPNMTLPATV